MNIDKKEEEEAVERTTQADETLVQDQKVKNSPEEESNSRKQMGKERTLDLHIDLEKPDKESLDGGRLPFRKQQPKAPKSDPKPENPGNRLRLDIHVLCLPLSLLCGAMIFSPFLHNCSQQHLLPCLCR